MNNVIQFTFCKAHCGCCVGSGLQGASGASKSHLSLNFWLLLCFLLCNLSELEKGGIK